MRPRLQVFIIESKGSCGNLLARRSSTGARTSRELVELRDKRLSCKVSWLDEDDISGKLVFPFTGRGDSGGG